jgi:glycerol kinase
MHRYILAIDQSTSASKVMLFSGEATLLSRVTLPHMQHYPRPGFVEHDADEIFAGVLNGIGELLNINNLSPGEIALVAITNQRETAVIWDKTTGLPVSRAAVWQCLRGEDFCGKLKVQGVERMIREKTGLVIDPYFSASKLHWVINNIDGLKGRVARGELLWGTMDSWLLWKLSGGRVHATDHTNACRTMLFNIRTMEWDKELMDIFGLHPSMFPEVKFNDEIFGFTDPLLFAGESIPIGGLMGDSHASLFGHQCTAAGMAKATYGTGSSVMLNIGREFRDAPGGLVTSIGFTRKGMVDYVFEGNIHSTGDTVKWLVEGLKLIADTNECERLALSVKTNRGVYLVPAFSGLGAPHWDNNARAIITGMDRGTTSAHIARAALESIAYQIKDLIDTMETGGDTGTVELRVDGGPTRNDFLMQFQSDILERTVVRSGIEEISALGSVFMAGLAAGFWASPEEIGALQKGNRAFTPAMEPGEVKSLYSGWRKAVDQALHSCHTGGTGG